jgi:hypothetical protein
MSDQTAITQAPGLKAIFLYTKSAAIPPKGLQALIDAGMTQPSMQRSYGSRRSRRGTPILWNRDRDGND